MQLSRLLLSYPLHRAAVAGLSFGAAIIGARYLPAEQFSTVMSAAFLVKFLIILNFGATPGYFVSRYAKQGPLAQERGGEERRYLQFFGVQLVGFGLLLVAASLLWLPEYLVGAIAFVLVAPVFAVEPYLRYRRNFSFSLTPDLLLTIGMFGLIGLQLAETAMITAYLGLIGAFSALLWILAMRSKIPEKGEAQFGFREYRRVLAQGGPLYIASALFLLASSMDRLLLPLYGGDEQVSIYFLAHQLSLGSMIFVTAINFVNTVNLGEARQDHAVVDPKMVFGKLRTAALVALGSYAALVIAVYVLESVFLPETFDGLAWVAFILGAGLSLFFTSNAITPLVAYFHRQVPLSIAMGAVAVALTGNNALVYLNGFGAFGLAVGTSAALAAYAGFAIWFTFHVLRHQGERPPAHVN